VSLIFGWLRYSEQVLLADDTLSQMCRKVQKKVHTPFKLDNSMDLNALDVIIVGILAGSTMISLLRGFGREVLSLINFFMAFVLARLFAPQFAGLLINTIDNPALRSVVAFTSLFFITVFIGGMVTRLVSMLIKFGGLEMFDRILGTVFGFFRGAIIVLVVVGVVNWGGWFVDTPTWQNSVTRPYVLKVESWSRKVARMWLFEMNMDGLSDPLMLQIEKLRGFNMQ